METSRVPMVTCGGFQGHSINTCVCVWKRERGFSIALTDQLSFNKADHTHWALAVFVASLHSCPIAPVPSQQNRGNPDGGDTKYNISKYKMTVFLFRDLESIFPHQPSIKSVCVRELCVYDYVCSLCDIWCNFKNFSTCTTAWSNRAATCPPPPP